MLLGVLCVWAASVAPSAALAAAECAGREPRAADARTVLRRHRRYLVFPEGSSVGLSVVFAANYDVNVPGVWDITGEIGTAYELPDHYMRRRFYHEHDSHPSTQHHLNSNSYDAHEKYNIKSPTQHQNHKTLHKLHHSTINNHHKYHETTSHVIAIHPHYMKRVDFNHSKGQQWTKHRYQRHLQERRDWERLLQRLLAEYGMDAVACLQRARCEARRLQPPHDSLLRLLLQLFFTLPLVEKSKADCPAQCAAATVACGVSFLDLDFNDF